MEVTSLIFPAFVMLGAIIYWNVKGRYQWVVLLVLSLVFYCTYVAPVTFIYVLISTFTAYGAAIFFERSGSERRNRIVVVLALLVDMGILAVLKYTNLVIRTWNFFGSLGSDDFSASPLVHWAAPLGISFFTLQIVSYLIDCYRGELQPERNPLKLLLFTCYFPMMISGPICRYGEMRDQLSTEHHFQYERATRGLKRMAFGAMKKMVVGNRILIVVNILDGDTARYDGAYIWLSAILYTVFLYADFSGCMDIVLGASEIFGIDMPENFRAPFLSRSTQEFWRRWHITLGAWLRDYVLNSLLKSRAFINMTKAIRKRYGKKAGRRIPAYLSMLVVWFAMGLWHGNSWKYILGEGMWFWLVIVLGMMFEDQNKKLMKLLHIDSKAGYWHAFQSVRTFLIASVGNFFFKAASMPDAIRRISIGFTTHWDPSLILQLPYLDKNTGGTAGLCLVIAGLALIVAADVFKYREIDANDVITSRPAVVRWGLYTVVLAMIFMSLSVQSAPFAYAQF